MNFKYMTDTNSLFTVSFIQTKGSIIFQFLFFFYPKNLDNMWGFGLISNEVIIITTSSDYYDVNFHSPLWDYWLSKQFSCTLLCFVSRVPEALWASSTQSKEIKTVNITLHIANLESLRPINYLQQTHPEKTLHVWF